MSLTKTIEKISHLDFLIRNRKTGRALELAVKVGVSERTIFNYLRELRDLGVPVSWSRAEKSYIYEDPGQILFCFQSEYPPEQSRMNSLPPKMKKKSWPAGNIY